MHTSANKVQLTLTNEEIAILTSYGTQFGYSLPRTLRFVISKATEKLLDAGVMPEFNMSEERESIALQAIDDHKKGKTHQIKDVEDFFDKE